MPDSGNFATRATVLRDTAKWIAAVFAGAGAILFSGLSFTSVTKAASTPDWLLPVVLGAVPVLAAAWAVRTAASVITAEGVGAADLLAGSPSSEAARADLAEVERLGPATIGTYGSLAAFSARLATAREDVDRARRLAEQNPQDRELQGDLDAAYRVLDGLQDGVRDLVLCADYVRVKTRYDRARIWLACAALVAVAGAAASGVVATQPDRAKASAPAPAPTPAPARFAVATPVKVVLTAAGRAAMVDPTCPIDGQRAIAIGGDYRKPLLLFHGKACRQGWVWAAGAGQAIVLPARAGG